MEDSKRNQEQEEEYNISLPEGIFLSHPLPGDEVVLSGISGVFPNSCDIYDYMNKLFNKETMVTPDHRWNYEHPEMPLGSGTIPDIEGYDAGFFGVHENQAHSLDPMNRLVQERVIEAIFDAGLNPKDLENTNTGVFVGICFSETEKYWFHDNLVSESHAFTGVTRSMMAHRLSYFLKLKGPSFTGDCACSSSLFSIEYAYRALRMGLIDTAIVCGVNLCTHPFVTLQFFRLGVLSPDGQSYVFDRKGNGYARSEAVGAIIMQRKRDSKRVYAEIVHAKTNNDGFKETGITFPSRDAQRLLLRQFYEECKIDKTKLSYLETHGTGTFVGDPEECAAIDDVLTEGRNTPLLIGSVKSNIGHTEPASGVCSIVKSVIALESGYIPPNINFEGPKDEMFAIKEGRLKVVTEKTPLPDKPALIGISSFGFGGGNCHILLKQHEKEKINYGIPEDNLPRLVCLSGRTKEAVLSLMNNLKNNKPDAEYIRLLQDVFRNNIPNHIYRGYTIISKSGELCRFLEFYPQNLTQFYLCFGELNNWFNIGNKLMALPPFSNSLYRTQKTLLKTGINLIDILLKSSSVESDKYHVLGSVAVQIGLIDTLKAVKIKPISHFGYSFGELLSAYYSGVLNLQETIGCALVINEAANRINSIYSNSKKTPQINNLKIVNGNNSSATLDILKAALKSSDLVAVRKELMQELSLVLTVKNGNNFSNNIKYASPEYFYNALVSNGTFNIGKFETGTLVLNIGTIPIKEKSEDIKIISLFPPENKNHLVDLLRVLGNLYLNGHNGELDKLYPEIQYPVSRGTRLISPFIEWKHGRKWFRPSFESELLYHAKRGSSSYKIQLSHKDFNYIGGHVIDGRILFPATGYLCMVWETLAVLQDCLMNEMTVVFENCKFLRATNISTKGSTTFNVTVHPTGNFEVVQGDSAVVTGKITKYDEDLPLTVIDRNDKAEYVEKYPLTNKEIYKELRLRGYNYNKEFRSIQSCNINATKATIRWSKNWVTYMDNMLQMKILHEDTRWLFVPTYIAKLTIQGKKHTEWMNSFKEPEKPLDLPARYNPTTDQISSGFIEINGLLASSIARKKDLGIPVLEKYVFIPNTTSLELEESIRVNMQIFLENALVYKVKAIELVDDFTLKDSQLLSPIVQNVLEDQPLVKPFMKIYSNNPIETTVPLEQIKPLDTENDVMLVIASNILQRPKILQEALAALKDNGFIISRESLDFVPSDSTENSLTLFTVHKTSSETILLMKKVKQITEPVTIKIDSNNFTWIDELQDIVKSKTKDNVILYSENEQTSGILGLVNCLRREPDSPYIRCVFMMDQSAKYDPQNTEIKEQIDKNMAINVYKDGLWGTYRHLLFNTIVNKESEHCFISSLVRGDLSSLKWIEGPLKSDCKIQSERSLVYVNYSSLNFRDVMVALSKINYEVVCRNRLELDYIQGFEYSGKKKDGSRVMGIATLSLSSMLSGDDYWMFPVPDSMSLAEAATIPVIYGTVIYGLLMRTKLKPGNTILIHSGTGGVGQAAIRAALYHGCTVFATVGSQEKKEHLKKLFPQLKDSHIGSSRSLAFEHLIKRETRGKGVDFVLNSLAEDKLISSIRCLAKGGNLVEIGKFDIANNNEFNLLLFQKEASFHGVMLDQLFVEEPCIKRQLGRILEEGLRDGWIQPLSRTIFKFSETEEAFRYMASGKHVGKVLLEVRPEAENNIPEPRLFPCIARFCCDPSKTYIIVGGLGGFGLELADWLVLRGARKLVLTSRNGISKGYQNLRVRTWLSYGAHVKVSKADVTTRQGCQQLLTEAEKLGPVDSLFNLAVVLADALFENQTNESYKKSFGPKAFATQFLDEESRILCPNLRNFVIFSSVSCGRGNAGQTNYGMANSIMERICEKRKNEGYPALAIQWGAIGEVGLVAELQEENLELEIGGTLQQKVANCLNVLDKFLTQNDCVIVSSMVVAEKRGGANAADNMVDAVINILGIQDIKSISLHSTLAELGMDSMTAVEIKQTLERDFEVFLSAKDIRTMTLKRLKEIQEEKLADNGQSNSTDNINTGLGFDMLLSNTLTQDKAKDILVRLNSRISPESSAPTIIFFPGIEGQSIAFENLAHQLEAHVYALYYALELPTKNIQDMVEILLPSILGCLSKSEPFKLVAHSYGSVFAFEIAHRLEAEGYNGEVALLDGSPILMKFWCHDLCQKPSWETILLMSILKYYGFTEEELVKYEESLIKCSNWDERVSTGEEFVKNKSTLDAAFQKALANGFHQKIEHLRIYEPTYKKIVSPTLLLRASETNSGLNDDYELSTVLETPAIVEVIEANHANIFDSAQSSKLLNSWLTGSSNNNTSQESKS